MAGFEDLIRGALIKQGNTTPESREKIYASARQALDRMVAENASLDPAIVEAQRAKLEDAISKIEADHSDVAPVASEPMARADSRTPSKVEMTEKPAAEAKPKEAEPEVKADEPPITPDVEPMVETSPDSASEVGAPETVDNSEERSAHKAEDAASPEPEDQTVPKIELSKPPASAVAESGAPVQPTPTSETLEDSPPEEPVQKAEPPKVEPEPITVQTPTEKTPPPDFPPLPEVENAAPPLSQEEVVPKIELSEPPAAPPPAEPSPPVPSAQPSAFALEADDPSPAPVIEPEKSQADTAPDILSAAAPIVASTAAAAVTLDLSKGTRPAPDLVADPKPQTARPDTVGARVEPSVETPSTPPPPALEEPKVNTQTDEPVRLEYEPEQPDIYPQSYSGNALDERKPYAKLLLWTIILVGIGVAIWWAVTFGPALIKAQFDGSVPNPRATLETGSFVPDGSGQDGWVTVFVPGANDDDIVAGSRTNMEVQRENDQQVMRMASPDSSSANNLKIRIPRNVMESLRGKAATFELVIRAANSENQEFVLFCEFSKMGNCGRKRFSAGSNSEPFIFDVLVNDVALPANEEAYLSLNTDFSGQGRALDLYSVRVRTGA